MPKPHRWQPLAYKNISESAASCPEKQSTRKEKHSPGVRLGQAIIGTVFFTAKGFPAFPLSLQLRPLLSALPSRAHFSVDTSPGCAHRAHVAMAWCLDSGDHTASGSPGAGRKLLMRLKKRSCFFF